MPNKRSNNPHLCKTLHSSRPITAQLLPTVKTEEAAKPASITRCKPPSTTPWPLISGLTSSKHRQLRHLQATSTLFQPNKRARHSHP